MMITPSMSPGEKRRQQNANFWISAFIQGPEPLKMREQRTVFPGPQIQISLDTRSLIPTWTWMTTQTMNSASDVWPRWPSSVGATPPWGRSSFPGRNSSELGGGHRAWHSSPRLTGLEQPYFFCFCTNKTQNHSNGSIENKQAKKKKKKVSMVSEVHFCFH